MAAALQQTPIAFQSKLPISTRITAKFHGNFSSSFKIPKLSVKLARKSRRRGVLVKASDTPAGSYATALSDVAVATGTLEETAADLEKVEKLFSDPQVGNFFSNPIIEIEKKREVLDQITSTSKLLPHVANFLNIVIDMERVDIIDEIVKEFEIIHNIMTDTELAVVSSVVKLETQHLAQIAKQVQRLSGAKNVRIKTVIDPSLVAGFTIRYGHTGSRLIDMSVRKQLEDIADQVDLEDLQLVS